MRDHDPRKFAAECLRQAEQALTEADRLMFLDMAQRWLSLAERQDLMAGAPAMVTECSQHAS